MPFQFSFFSPPILMQKVFSHARRGFTLIELLLVIGIIAILASIVIVAINPTKQLGDARDSQRRSDVNTILSAVYQYAIDNQGNYPPDLQTAAVAGTTYEICACNETVCAKAAACGVAVVANSRVNLLQLTGSYLLALPNDPRYASGTTTISADNSTEYTIQKLASGRIEVCAPATEQATEEICVTR